LEERKETAKTVEQKYDEFLHSEPENDFVLDVLSKTTVKKIEKKREVTPPKLASVGST
jgi:hypothetical protein